jgi:hypothetical protein
MLSEKEAWYKIAMEFYEGNTLKDFGICDVAGMMWLRDEITMTTSDIICDKAMEFTEYLPRYFGSFLCAPTPRNYKFRADFCMLMYYELGGE